MASAAEASRPSRVLFLVAHLHKGGMQKALSNISCALGKGIEQYVGFFGSENPGFEYRGKMVDFGIPGGRKEPLPRKAWNFGRRIPALQRFIDRERIDTVASFGEAANLLNLLTRGKRTVVSVRVSLEESLRGAGADALYGALYRTSVRLLYGRAERVVAVSAGIADDLHARFGVPRSRIEVIGNGYHLEDIRRLAAEELEPELEPVFRNPVVVSAGSLTPQKGYPHLLRAFASARREVPPLQLAILGEGPLLEDLRLLAAELGVAGAVHFLGFRSNPYRYMARGTAYVSTSLFEGFPNALAEAMVCGVPAVSTDCRTGPAEILGDSAFGILIPAVSGGNAAAVEEQAARAIVSLAEPGLNARYRDLSRSRAATLDIGAVAARWGALLAP